jgi:hypothetical protein
VTVQRRSSLRFDDDRLIMPRQRHANIYIYVTTPLVSRLPRLSLIGMIPQPRANGRAPHMQSHDKHAQQQSQWRQTSLGQRDECRH